MRLNKTMGLHAMWCVAAAGACSRHCASVSAEPASTSMPSTLSCSISFPWMASDIATPITGHRGWSPVKRTHRTPAVKSTDTQTRRCPVASSPLSRCLSRNSSLPTTTSTKTDTYAPLQLFS